MKGTAENRAPRTTPPRAGPRRGLSLDAVGFGLVVIAAQLVGLSVLMFISPATFFNEIAPFGIRNDHYLRDGATFQLALGVGALVATQLADWRVPVLFILALQFSLHTLNHGLDIMDTDPAWLGYANFITLAAGSLLLFWLLFQARKRNHAAR